MRKMLITALMAMGFLLGTVATPSPAEAAGHATKSVKVVKKAAKKNVKAQKKAKHHKKAHHKKHGKKHAKEAS